jgi:hypothetical protein
MGKVAALDIGSTRINVAVPVVASASDCFTGGLKIGRSIVVGFRKGQFSNISVLHGPSGARWKVNRLPV